MSKSNLVIRQPHQEQIEFTRPILVLAQVPGNVVQHGAVHDLAAFNTRATWLDGYEFIEKLPSDLRTRAQNQVAQPPDA